MKSNRVTVLYLIFQMSRKTEKKHTRRFDFDFDFKHKPPCFTRLRGRMKKEEYY